jgi:hypothetical protein
VSTPVHGELQIVEHFLGSREIVIRSVGGVEFDRKGDDRRESVPFSCRAGRNVRQQAATRSNKRQLATRRSESV